MADTCANCGKTYGKHLKGTYCRIGSDSKWFPSKLANAIADATNNCASAWPPTAPDDRSPAVQSD